MPCHNLKTQITITQHAMATVRIYLHYGRMHPTGTKQTLAISFEDVSLAVRYSDGHYGWTDAATLMTPMSVQSPSIASGGSSFMRLPVVRLPGKEKRPAHRFIASVLRVLRGDDMQPQCRKNAGRQKRRQVISAGMLHKARQNSLVTMTSNRGVRMLRTCYSLFMKENIRCTCTFSPLFLCLKKKKQQLRVLFTLIDVYL